MSEALTLAQGLGYAAFAFGVACFSQTDDRRFKLFMAAECAAYAAHFHLLGQPTAVASSLVSLSRSLVALTWRTRWAGGFFIALSAGLGLWLVQGWHTALPIVASCLGSYALFFQEGVRMRATMLVGTLCWLLHNLLVGSLGGSALEAVLAATNLRTLLQMQRLSRASPPGTAPESTPAAAPAPAESPRPH